MILPLSLVVIGLLHTVFGEAAREKETSFSIPTSRAHSGYADPTSCAKCHEKECAQWNGSDHSRSMAHASEKTVLGDFSGVEFLHLGFDDLALLDDDETKILLTALFESPPVDLSMQTYAVTKEDGAPGYNTPGRKFKPSSQVHFDDLALAVGDAAPAAVDKLKKNMSPEQRTRFDDETSYREALRFRHPGDMATAQHRIIDLVHRLAAEKKIALPPQATRFRLFCEEGKFFCENDLGRFEILFTFGTRPLQQYLVALEGGRLQCLPVAWDTIDRRWFHLYPKERILPDDPLHWTKPAQNWNYMCADCHTTHYRKNYDPKTQSYASTFTEVNVGCQTCHGPCGKHVAVAEKHDMTIRWKDGIPKETFAFSEADNQETLRSCALCHTRRRLLREGAPGPHESVLDRFVPETLDRNIYFPDGQLLEEAFEVGSFMQSKMFHKGVGCTNCHDPHTLELRYEGNRLCAQCHAPSIYDTPDHHFHPDRSKPGTMCVECHFPQSTYMLVDPRRDHSIRKPSPALSLAAGVPNACTQCHHDRSRGETLVWARDHVERWYAEKRKATVGYSATAGLEDHYALAIEAGRRGDPAAIPKLMRVIDETSGRDFRPVVRAAALMLLGRLPARPGEDLPSQVLENLKVNENPLLRLAAVEAFANRSNELRLKHLPPRLSDPVRAVRSEAVRLLAVVAHRLTSEEEKKAFEKAKEEFIATQRLAADQAASYLNLAVLEYDLAAAQMEEVHRWYAATMQMLERQAVEQRVLEQAGGAAVREAMAKREAEAATAEATRIDFVRKLTGQPLRLYGESLAVDATFIPSWINRAMLHDEREEPAEAEACFRKVLDIDPENGDAAYSLGLLLAEQGRSEESLACLRQAAGRLPNNPRVRYNLGLMLMQLGKNEEAGSMLRIAVAAEPENVSFLHALAVLSLRTGDRAKAMELSDRLIKLEPTEPGWQELRRAIGQAKP